MSGRSDRTAVGELRPERVRRVFDQHGAGLAREPLQRRKVDGVAAQSDSLGFEPAVVYVPHPIQNRTKAEIEAIADDAFAKVMALLKQ